MDPISDGNRSERLIDAEDMTTEMSKLNGVYRLIRKKELQRSKRGTQLSESKERGTASRSEDRRESIIEAGEVLVGDRSRLNPVYRMIRRKELRLRFPAPVPENDNISQSLEQTTERRYRRIDTNEKLGTPRDLSTASPSSPSHSSLIDLSELSSEQARMNPVFRLIRKTELKKRFLEKPDSLLSRGGLGDFVSGFDPFGSLLPDPLKDSYLADSLDPGGGESQPDPLSEPLPLTGNAAVDRTIRIRQLIMRLRKESKLKGSLSNPNVPQVPWLLLQDTKASDSRALSQSQNQRLIELREGKKNSSRPSMGDETHRTPFTLFDKALGSTDKQWKQEVKNNMTSESFEQLQRLQSEFPSLDVGRLLGIQIEPQRSRSNQKLSHSASETPVSKVKSLLKLLEDLGCPSEKALEFVSKELDGLILGGRTSLNNSNRVGEKLAGLSAVLGGLSMEDSVALATLQPSALNRRPATLESNLKALEGMLGMSSARILDMVTRYPPLMELSTSTVRVHLTAIRSALSDKDSDMSLLREALYICPSWLGMKPQSMKTKVELVRASLQSLYTNASGREEHGIDVEFQLKALLFGYPNLLALGSKTLEVKFKRLIIIVGSRPEWAEEILHMKPKSLGRILGAGSKTISRLDYFIQTGEDAVRPDATGGRAGGGRTLGLLKLITLSAQEFNNCFPRFVLR